MRCFIGATTTFTLIAAQKVNHRPGPRKLGRGNFGIPARHPAG
jgi:hypothetical protein